MFDYLYKWMQNIACYMVLITAFLQMMPNQEYKKYIRFFTGLILIVLLVTPIMKIFGIEERFSEIYKGKEYESTVREIESSTEYLKDIDISGYFPDELKEDTEKDSTQKEEESESIDVGEVQIGR